MLGRLIAPSAILGSLHRRNVCDQGRRNFFDVFYDSVRFEQSFALFGDQQRHLSGGRDVHEPLRFVAEFDELYVIRHALCFKERRDPLNERADFEASDFDHLIDPFMS